MRKQNKMLHSDWFLKETKRQLTRKVNQNKQVDASRRQRHLHLLLDLIHFFFILRFDLSGKSRTNG